MTVGFLELGLWLLVVFLSGWVISKKFNESNVERYAIRLGALWSVWAVSNTRIPVGGDLLTDVNSISEVFDGLSDDELTEEIYLMVEEIGEHLLEETEGSAK